MFSEVLDYNIYEEGNLFSFYTYEIPLPLLNSIRRYLMSEYKKWGISIEDVEIIKNTSILNDDFIKHRISMLSFSQQEKTPIELELNVLSNYQKHLEVFSNSLKNFYNSKYFINDEIFVTKLKYGEELFLKLKTSYNNCKNGGVQYRPTNVIVIKKMKIIRHDIKNKKLLTRIKKFLIDKYDMKDETKLNDKNILGVLDTSKTNLDYVNIIKRELKIKQEIELSVDDYVIDNKQVRYFMMECDYMNPKELFLKTLDFLVLKIKETDNKKILVKNINNKYYYNIDDGCATVGNIMQHYMNRLEEVEYSFFNKKFPMDKNIELQVFLYNNNKPINYIFYESKKLFEEEVEEIKKLLMD